LYNSYQSLFSSYPLLRSSLPQQQQQQQHENTTRATLPLPLRRRSTLKSTNYLASLIPSPSPSGFASTTISTISPSHSSSFSSSSSLPIDLQPLRLTALLKSLDPDKQICQYEVPGGGVCRDQTCEDVHLERAQPTGASIVFSGALGSTDISAPSSLSFTLLIAIFTNDFSPSFFVSFLDEDTILFLARVFPQQDVDQIRQVYSTTATAQKGSSSSSRLSSLEDRIGATLEALGVVAV
jgi:hypothetical protein